MPKPKIIDTGFKINSPKLWAIDIPVEEIPISDLEHNLDIAYLEQEGTDDWNLTPRMLLENFDQEISHANRVRNGDLSHPIEIYLHQNTWIILDGVHRFTKLVQLGKKTIKVRKITPEIVEMTRRT